MQWSSPRGVPRDSKSAFTRVCDALCVAGAPLRGPIFQRPVIMGSRHKRVYARLRRAMRGNDRTRDHIPEASPTLRAPLQAAAVRVAFPAECGRRRMVQGTAGSAVPAVVLSPVAVSFPLPDGGGYAPVRRTSPPLAHGQVLALVRPDPR